MKENYIKINNLSVSKKLYRFVNTELLPGTKIKKKNFWNGFDKSVHELAPKNRKLLEFRERLQKKIDEWHRQKKIKKINLKFKDFILIFSFSPISFNVFNFINVTY